MDSKFWRRWHRWISVPATLFVAYAAITGVLVAGTEFFGEEEALRERTRDLISPVHAGGPQAVPSQALIAALATVARQAGDVPIDKIELQFKGDAPTVTVFTGKPTGGEDRRFVMDARDGHLLHAAAYADKPLIHRIHSGEVFGDGGLVGAMLWGLALAILSISGFVVYIAMFRARPAGRARFFW
jgi:uncharacterized iron-regulated membrane protein